jgi:hypothetical protein
MHGMETTTDPAAPAAATERETLINRCIGVNTLDKIADARRALAEWLGAHPDDNGIRDLDARLAEMDAELREQSGGSFGYLTNDQGMRPGPRAGVTGAGDAPARDER